MTNFKPFSKEVKMIPSVYGGFTANSYYVPSHEEQNFLAVRDIVAPLEYFENAERNYSMNKDPLSIEMMSNAIQAYVKQLPEAVDEALSLVDRMPPECLQRNDVFIAILDACSHFEKKNRNPRSNISFSALCPGSERPFY